MTAQQHIVLPLSVSQFMNTRFHKSSFFVYFLQILFDFGNAISKFYVEFDYRPLFCDDVVIHFSTVRVLCDVRNVTSLQMNGVMNVITR